MACSVSGDGMRTGTLENEYRVLIFTGHSGGHLFPAIAFAEKFREKFPLAQRGLVTSVKAQKILSASAHDIESIRYLPSFPAPRRNGLGYIPFAWNLFRAFLYSFYEIIRFKPDLCAGFGSYASYPGMLLASKMNIPTFIHEQNAVFGEATRRLISHVDYAALTFPSESESLGGTRMEYVGLPMRKSLLQEQKKPNAGGPPVFHVLVTGGSQGSHQLNLKITETFSLLTDEEKKKIVVNHITGHEDDVWVSETYRKCGVTARVTAFSNRMDQMYAEAHMAITRGGSNTLFELAHFKLPAVVIPYPYAASHQLENVKYFEKEGGVFSRNEKDLTPGWLLEKIRLLLTDSSVADRMSQNLARISTPDAADRLVSLAERLIRGERL